MKSVEIVQRRVLFAKMFEDFPCFFSPEFLQVVERGDVPQEVLVKVVRILRQDQEKEISQRLLSVIFSRILLKNQAWANSVLKMHRSLGRDEKHSMSLDLCEDLNESILKALFNPKRRFWEENFSHCLKLERMHVHRAFMMREGHISASKEEKGRRIPRKFIVSIEKLPQCVDTLYDPFEIEDESAHAALQSTNMSFLIDSVKRLPPHLSAVVLQSFWGDKTEKDIAQSLGVTDRTVRNRLQMAIHRLHTALTDESEFLQHTQQEPLPPDPQSEL